MGCGPFPQGCAVLRQEKRGKKALTCAHRRERDPAPEPSATSKTTEAPPPLVAVPMAGGPSGAGNRAGMPSGHATPWPAKASEWPANAGRSARTVSWSFHERADGRSRKRHDNEDHGGGIGIGLRPGLRLWLKFWWQFWRWFWLRFWFQF